jgi:Ni/Co efflux regulator RcnB
MKRLFITAVAALTLAGPLAATAAYAQPGRYDNNRYDNDRRGDNSWRRDSDRDGIPNRVDRWDNRRYNGYYYNNWFYRGAPPAAYYGRPGFRVGYRSWSRGEYIPRGYPVHVVDYRAYRLNAPPRGYHWVRDDRGDFLLAAIATGIIASVIASSNY